MEKSVVSWIAIIVLWGGLLIGIMSKRFNIVEIITCSLITISLTYYGIVYKEVS